MRQSPVRLVTSLPICGLLLMASSVPAQSSVLKDVLKFIDLMDAKPLEAMFGNIALNSAGISLQPKSLRDGDIVIVGYDRFSQPIQMVAGPNGLMITPEIATTASSSLSAGFYPTGSAIYTLPPAGQLSLFDESVDGQKLMLMREALLTRIDGSINFTNIGIIIPDLAPTFHVATYGNLTTSLVNIPKRQLPTWETTVLGAVNSGEMVSHIDIILGELPDNFANLELGQIKVGPNKALVLANTSTILVTAQKTSILSDADRSKAILNMAANSMEVRGNVSTRVGGVMQGISRINTTVIGAVNSGKIEFENLDNN